MSNVDLRGVAEKWKPEPKMGTGEPLFGDECAICAALHGPKDGPCARA